jgi:hypothetical protein
MAEMKSSSKRRITSKQRESYRARQRRDWRSVWIRRAVFDMVLADRRSDAETYGEVIARWGRDRAKYGVKYGSVDSVFIVPDQTKRSQ